MHQAGYCISAGLECLVDWVETSVFNKTEIEALKTVKDRKGQPLFTADFLAWLQGHPICEGITLRAIPEPSVSAVALAGVAGLLMRRRRA